MLSAMLAGSIAPLVVLAIAAAAFANEIEDRTLANLTLVADSALADRGAEAARDDHDRRAVHRRERVPHELRRVPRRRRGRRSRSPSRRSSALRCTRRRSCGSVSSRRRRSASGCCTSCCGKDSSRDSSPGVRLLSIRHYAIALDARARSAPVRECGTPDSDSRDRHECAGRRRLSRALHPATATDGRSVGASLMVETRLRTSIAIFPQLGAV